MKTIFNYSDPNLFLKDMWTEIKLKKSDFSVRAWANYLGLNAHAPLHQMIIGKRKISHRYIPKFITYFKLGEQESLYFTTLVKLSHSKTTQEINFYNESLKKLRPKEQYSPEILDNYEIQRDPIHFFILEIVELSPIVNDYKIIQKKLILTYTTFEVKVALQRLIDSGFITVNSEGKLCKTQKHLFSTQDVQNLALVQYHKKLALIAQSAIEKQDLNEREFNGVSFNIDSKAIREIKKDIRDFISQIVKRYESSPGEGDSTYQLNLNFFKVSQR